MAYTTQDLSNVESAIRALIAGERSVSVTRGEKSATFEKADLPALRTLRDEIKGELNISSGTVVRRTYAKQGGRG